MDDGDGDDNILRTKRNVFMWIWIQFSSWLKTADHIMQIVYENGEPLG